ncbi:EFR1 family ferrodoxin [Konateibacter massiliensis]|uniref:EFR1 family ferrodoxin n=1 Tax=Konateibacter massiliensis TaxID=2002841 RepID=UPI000C14676D|nr:EFR1 family ferrodoxin [Konateibacter massiliensis]
MRTILFYFTGTGNSYYIASELASLARDKDVMQIDSLLNYKEYDLNDYKRIGFVLPVYYNHLPQICIDFIKGMDLKNICNVFFIASYSGNTGFVFENFRDITSFRDKTIQEYKVKMPGNYILEYGAFPQKLQTLILNQAKIKIKKINEDMHSNNLQKKLIKANLISRLYKTHSLKKIENFSILGQGFYANDRCIKCLKCIKNCPGKNISIFENELNWGSSCKQCMRCIQICPEEAVSHEILKKERKRYINPYVNM